MKVSHIEFIIQSRAVKAPSCVAARHFISKGKRKNTATFFPGEGAPKGRVEFAQAPAGRSGETTTRFGAVTRDGQRAVAKKTLKPTNMLTKAMDVALYETNFKGRGKKMKASHWEWISENMKSKKFTQADVARCLGVDRSAVTNIKAGKRRLQLAELERLETLFGVKWGLPASSEVVKGQAWSANERGTLREAIAMLHVLKNTTTTALLADDVDDVLRRLTAMTMRAN